MLREPRGLQVAKGTGKDPAGCPPLVIKEAQTRMKQGQGLQEPHERIHP